MDIVQKIGAFILLTMLLLIVFANIYTKPVEEMTDDDAFGILAISALIALGVVLVIK